MIKLYSLEELKTILKHDLRFQSLPVKIAILLSVARVADEKGLASLKEIASEIKDESLAFGLTAILKGASPDSIQRGLIAVAERERHCLTQYHSIVDSGLSMIQAGEPIETINDVLKKFSNDKKIEFAIGDGGRGEDPLLSDAETKGWREFENL